MNKKISFSIAIIIIVVCAVLTGLIVIWQYRFIPEIKIPTLTSSEKKPSEKKPEVAPEEGKFSIGSKHKDYPESYAKAFIENELYFTNTQTQETKIINTRELIPNEMVSFMEILPEPDQRLSYIFWVDPLKWSLDKKYFWGTVALYSTADPSIPSEVSIFSINIETWEIEKFAIPSGNLVTFISPDKLNLVKEAVLFETSVPQEGLSLHLYYFRLANDRIIISYSEETFRKYYEKDWYYFLQSRLQSKWIDDNSISYIDLVTGGEIIKKID